MRAVSQWSERLGLESLRLRQEHYLRLRALTTWPGVEFRLAQRDDFRELFARDETDIAARNRRVRQNTFPQIRAAGVR